MVASLGHEAEQGPGFLGISVEKEGKLKELASRRERGKVSKNDYELNYLAYLIEMGESLRRSDLQPREEPGEAVVLESWQFAELGTLMITLKTGQRIIIDSDDFPPDNVLIIYPDDLGTQEDERRWDEEHKTPGS
ncbi:MAG: hypothetical protein UW69_C0040G0013 [Microgenomates group bacterium GW2011_GWA2_44_7]|nr:MAG: hypothetical protein UW69_C0040G0013 [Microgenomates group bacterium GW2011_GWA2_44_7]